MEKQKQMTELEKVNKARLKKNPTALPLCDECDLVKKEFCKKCAEKQTKRLDNFLDEDRESFDISTEERIQKKHPSWFVEKRKIEDEESVTDSEDEVNQQDTETWEEANQLGG